MKTTAHSPRSTRRRARQSGMAVIVVLALLAIILVYIGANARALHQLGRELKLVEQQQIHRVALPQQKTNPPVALAPENAGPRR